MAFGYKPTLKHNIQVYENWVLQENYHLLDHSDEEVQQLANVERKELKIKDKRIIISYKKHYVLFLLLLYGSLTNH